MELPIHTCMTKAIIADGDQLQTGPKWITSRRALLKLYSDRLQCGNWVINYDEIREAVLASFRSPIFRIPGCILSLRTDYKTYHFGLNGWRYWKGELPFPVTRKETKLRQSIISLFAKAALTGLAIYYVGHWVATW